MNIEVARGLKYHLMTFVHAKVHPGAKGGSDLAFLQDLCKKEFLSRDEFQHYQGLIEKLPMG